MKENRSKKNRPKIRRLICAWLLAVCMIVPSLQYVSAAEAVPETAAGTEQDSSSAEEQNAEDADTNVDVSAENNEAAQDPVQTTQDPTDAADPAEENASEDSQQAVPSNDVSEENTPAPDQTEDSSVIIKEQGGMVTLSTSDQIFLNASYELDDGTTDSEEPITVSFNDSDEVQLSVFSKSISGYALAENGITTEDGTPVVKVVRVVTSDGTAKYEAEDEAGNVCADLNENDKIVFHYTEAAKNKARRSRGNDGDLTSFRILKVWASGSSNSSIRKAKKAMYSDEVTFELCYIDESGEKQPISSLETSGTSSSNMRRAAKKQEDSSVSLQDVMQNGGEYTWNNLPKYDAEGKEIQYSVAEAGAEKTGYKPSYQAMNINGVKGMKIQNIPSYSIAVEKIWIDDGADHSQDSISVSLMESTDEGESWIPAIDVEGNEVSSIELNASNSWEGEFDRLAGSDQIYKVEETGVPDGYKSEVVKNSDDSYQVYNIKIRSIDIKKIWNDQSNKNRPESVTVTLTGKVSGNEVYKQSFVLSESNSWEITSNDTPEYDTNGNQIEYSVSEEAPDGYIAEISGNMDSGFTVTNTSKKIDIPVQKMWNDGASGESVEVELLANGEPTGSTLTLNENNSWKAEFTSVDRFDKDGNEIAYSVRENTTGYQTTVTGDTMAGFTIANSPSTETCSIPVRKIWSGGDMRPAVTIHLYSRTDDSGEWADTHRSLTLDGTADEQETEAWYGSFTDVPVYASNGTKIQYKVTEDAVEGYDSACSGNVKDGFTVTNTSNATEPEAITAGNPPVQKMITGDTPDTDSDFVFVLQALPDQSSLPEGMESSQMPMPAGAEGLLKEVTITGAGSAEFGDIVYSQPGTYVYRVTEKNTGAKGYTYDSTVYTMTNVVTEENGYLYCIRTIQKDGSTIDTADFALDRGPERASYSFTNTYKKDEAAKPASDQKGQKPAGQQKAGKPAAAGHGPKTSDPLNSSLLLVLAAAAAAGLAAVIVRRKKHCA